jgi:hypothetical protein
VQQHHNPPQQQQQQQQQQQHHNPQQQLHQQQEQQVRPHPLGPPPDLDKKEELQHQPLYKMNSSANSSKIDPPTVS